ncbi:response regulator, partial [bacterium]|nr:response regulator [bacterium]
MTVPSNLPSSKILFVDDEIDHFLPLLGIVGDLVPGIEIYTASSGGEGLEKAFEERPDLVFLDIRMPDMNGIDVCRRLKEDPRTEKTNILFLTSWEMDFRSQMEAIRLADDFLRKPVKAVELATRIRLMLRLRHYTRHLEAMVEQKTREISQQRRLAARSERLAALGTLAGGIAHEINQPLNAIKVTVDGLLFLEERKKELSREKLLESIKFVSSQGDKISEIIQHMRSLVRSGHTEDPKPFSLNAAVRSALELIETQISSHGIMLQLDIPDDAPRMSGYSTLMEQVVINLVINA